ncbi:triose-phosphate isomerase [Methylococcus mesophilus]|uniref:triose-phosphate isomerase n=1 Tax=Methylococcus mesophilus TaxID=2993564 RepID=UPI00224B1CAD|nr:triose-phosphate isomerase [Methylococcus mesophilus]UZR30492.1 triose-phosphate isomerase [Methylococcus mesophilus]
MRRPLVIGNWKMNGRSASVARLLNDILSGIGDCKAEVGVCVPFVYIPQASETLKGTKVMLGAQNVADHNSGAFTGEISAGMLREFGCELAIVGHSERRLLYGESNELVASRYEQAIQGHLKPILCVGETLEQREQGRTLAVIGAQIDTVFEFAGVQSLEHAVIAYEPVWAVGTGRSATTGQAQEVHYHIRSLIARWNPEVAQAVQIIYGGSVKPENSAELFAMPDIDGGLIGGASLDARAFLSICHSVSV